MSHKLLIAMNIVGRKAETVATIESLSRSDIALETDLLLMVIEKPDMNFADVSAILQGNRFNSVTVENIQGKTYQWSAIHALEMLHAGDYEYFALMDNDCIFNPDWFGVLMQVKEQIEINGDKAGVLNAINVPHGAYMPKERNGIIIKRRMAGTVILMSREVALQLPLDLKVMTWKKRPVDWAICDCIYALGYIHGCPITSCAQHIGRKGNGMSERSWIKRGSGGLGFVPNEKIKDIWDRFNQ